MELKIVIGLAMGLILVTAAWAAPAGPAAADQNWPGAKWNEKLAKTYEGYLPIKETITELAKRAGVTDVSFTVEKKDLVMPVPLAAGITLKEAVQQAASFCGLVAQYEGKTLVISQGKGLGNWIAAIGGEPHAVKDGTVYLPKGHQAAGLTGWVWYAPAQGLGTANAWTMKQLFDAGLAVATIGVGESSGNPKGRAAFTEFYNTIVPQFKLAPKAVLLPQSRGGLQLYNWAAEHPDRVAAIGGIYPVCDLRSYPGLKKAAEHYGLSEADLTAQLAQNNPIDRLAPIAKAGIPIFHVHGDSDSTVPLDKNSGELIKRYKALGGRAELKIIPGKGHGTYQEFFQCRELTDFLIKQAKATIGEKPAATNRKPTATEKKSAATETKPAH